MRAGSHTVDSAQQHRDWLDLVDVSGPFLSLPVLREIWPALDSLDKPTRERLRLEHGTWQSATDAEAWLHYVLGELLEWDDDVVYDVDELAPLKYVNTEYDVTITPDFALVEPGEKVKPTSTRLVGLICPPGLSPMARVPGDDWPASTSDRLVALCRQHNVPLGLATNGRLFVLVWAPRANERRPAVTTTAVFDAISWAESAERAVVRAFVSLLRRSRFFAVPDEEALPALLERSLGMQEEITEALGVQVRQAAELLVAALGRADIRARERGEPGLRHVDAHDVYRGAVAVMMRIVFLLFAEERGLLPADNDLYATTYSAGQLYAELRSRANAGTEEELEHSTAGWHRLLALFNAVYSGIEHPRLRMHAHDGSLFDPNTYPWLPESIDDRTVLHMLRAVQHVEIGRGRSREFRRVSFGALDVEEIGYVYEGLLSYEGYRADEVVVGLVGTAGYEAEARLSELDRIVAADGDLAEALAEAYKDSKIGSPKAVAKRLASQSDLEREEARKKLLAVTGGDYELAEHLLPLFGVIRSDLRGLPVVILPGALYVTESALRKTTGTHYTPRALAEEVVEGALQPLVYDVGPLQTADESQWVPKSSADILRLKVADIAMGSAAFLVAAARYLAEQLVRAWSREGDPRAQSYVVNAGEQRTDADEDPVMLEARRLVIEHCLHGVDINPMAVEMAKLSLWLVSMDHERPFTFLDDRLVAGDSLLGITSLDQLEVMHLDPRRGRELHKEDLYDWTAGVRELVAEVSAERARLSEVDGSTVAGVDRKKQLLAEVERKTRRARFLADLTVGSALAHVGKADTASIAAASAAQKVDESPDEVQLERDRWLRTDLVDGAFDREPLHWPLVFPEVFEHGGFDAVVGNPPFLGGSKITGSSGLAYREHLVAFVAATKHGNADLIGYFVLRAHQLLNSGGQTGLVATNTLAQGDTREVALDQVEEAGAIIRQAIKSRPWPSRSAALEYCAVWTSYEKPAEAATILLDGVAVGGITTSLEPRSRVVGNPERLAANSRTSFQASKLDGIGFTLESEDAFRLLGNDHRNAKVVFPYLGGKDLNTRPDLSPSRYVINFHDWPEEAARRFPECYEQVRRLVYPERLKNNRKLYRDYWWQYAERRPGMLTAIAGLDRVIIITLHTKTVMPVIVPTGPVFSHALGVFATDDTAMLALLSSAPHYWWARARASSMKADLRYTPSDVFETLPLPELTEEMRVLGDRLDKGRREFMLSRQLGLTKTYNLVHDESCTDPDIVELRKIHREIDYATVKAYGWNDLLDQLDHGSHPVGRETRYTIGPSAQREILDRLLELNHERYAEEVAQGLHDKKTRKSKKATQHQETMFDV